MRKLLFAIALCVLSGADTKTRSATYINASDLEATLQRAPKDKVTDQQVRVDADKVLQPK
jgi:hypothetical protein